MSWSSENNAIKRSSTGTGFISTIAMVKTTSLDSKPKESRLLRPALSTGFTKSTKFLVRAVSCSSQMKGFSITSPRPFTISIGSPTARSLSIGTCSSHPSQESNGKTQTESFEPTLSRKQAERPMSLRHLSKSGLRAACLFLISGLALSGAASAVTLTDDSKLAKAQAGYYRLKVGSVDVTALSDGTLGFEAIEQLTNVKPGEAEKLLDRAYVKSPVDASVNAFLIHLGGSVDPCGCGDGRAPGAEAFQASGELEKRRLLPGTNHRHPRDARSPRSYRRVDGWR